MMTTVRVRMPDGTYKLIKVDLNKVHPDLIK